MRVRVPTLLEVQRAMRAGIVEHDSATAAGALATGLRADRLDIYRNTIFSGLTRALQLSFPAVQRLVGGEFFAGAADAFIGEHLPRTAYLDQYGGEFPDFLSGFPPAASLPYLADVAKLEWAVNRALHAPDETPLDLARLAALAPDEQGRVRLRAHPAIVTLQSNFPADEIWRAVLGVDDWALAALDLASGPVFLLIERDPAGVEVARLEKAAWRFLDALCRGEPLASAIDSAAEIDAAGQLAGHLAAGRFVAVASDINDSI